MPREAATARAQVGVLRYPYLSTPTGAPGPGPHTVPSAVGPGPRQCTGTRGPRQAGSPAEEVRGLRAEAWREGAAEQILFVLGEGDQSSSPHQSLPRHRQRYVPRRVLLLCCILPLWYVPSVLGVFLR